METIIKNNEKILKSFNEGGGRANHIRFCGKPDVDSALIKWFSQHRNANLPINRHLLMKRPKNLDAYWDIKNLKVLMGGLIVLSFDMG
ncbi:hypothetical protein QE152_g13732 [Popillia japonica]|uniref:Uncharacterized protein n=1 Tax=Popillia japonica TaxID=7064 RepID=A0AAW1LBE7_POPJA